MDDDDDRDVGAEAPLIQAITDFVRSMGTGDRAAAAAPEALLSIADAARYLNVSNTTVRNLAVGGKVRSTRVGDRIRFRRIWLDDWIDAGGGEVPTPPPMPKPLAAERPAPRPIVGRPRPRAEPKPKPPTFVQKIGDQEMRFLADAGRNPRAFTTWHVGAQAPLCGASGRWLAKVQRGYAPGYMCPKCLTAVAAFAEADLDRFAVRQVFMMRLTHRGETATPIRAGWHVGDGRRALCGKKDGPWALTEREPKAKQCFVCDHRTRWDGRDSDPNSLRPRPVTPLRVLIDAGPLDPPLVDLIKRHPSSLDARQAQEPMTKDTIWSREKWSEFDRTAERVGQFQATKGYPSGSAGHWDTYLISDNPDVSPITTDMALERLSDWADSIERALALYAKWSKEPASRNAARARPSRR